MPTKLILQALKSGPTIPAAALRWKLNEAASPALNSGTLVSSPASALNMTNVASLTPTFNQPFPDYASHPSVLLGNAGIDPYYKDGIGTPKVDKAGTDPLGGKTACSISLWYAPTGAPRDGSAVLMRWNAAFDAWQYLVQFSGTSLRFYLGFSGGNSAQWTPTGGSLDMTVGTGYLLTMTWDGAAIRVYKNGVEAAGTSAITGSVAPIVANTGPITLGSRYDGLSTTLEARGYYADLEIRDVCLTPTQIADLFAAGPA